MEARFPFFQFEVYANAVIAIQRRNSAENPLINDISSVKVADEFGKFLNTNSPKIVAS